MEVHTHRTSGKRREGMGKCKKVLKEQKRIGKRKGEEERIEKIRAYKKRRKVRGREGGTREDRVG